MRGVVVFLLLTMVLFTAPNSIAASDYVLPYPPAMPGSTTYILRRIQEKALAFWYFGEFGQFAYNRMLSDKYLVQAKILFEYHQYLLGIKALKESNIYFLQTNEVLAHTPLKKNGRPGEVLLLKRQAEKHIEILKAIERFLPKKYKWEDERKHPIDLNFTNEIQEAIEIRRVNS